MNRIYQYLLVCCIATAATPLWSQTKIDAERENLGSNINSKFDEYSPVISPDGKTLYYVRDGHTNNKGGVGEDIWYAKQKPNGTWGYAQNINAPLNNKDHNAVLSVSPDGERLLVMGVYSNGKTESGGLSIAHMKANKNGWLLPKKVVFDAYDRQETYRESYCMSYDEKVILLSIVTPKKGKPSNYGLNDLYASFVKEDGTWTAPINLGPVINTKGLEYSPFLAADGVTLYFSSDGHPENYGSNDIYVSKRLDDTWTNWSKPENLGPAINTKNFDADFTIPASGDYAYLASDKSGEGGMDIFRIKLPEKMRPNPSVLVHGKILNSVTLQPIEGDIAYKQNLNAKIQGLVNYDPETGDYMIIVPASKARYFMQATSEGFQGKKDTLDLTKITQYTEIQRDFLLKPNDPPPPPTETAKAVEDLNLYLKGKVYDIKTKQPLKALVSLRLQHGGKVENSVNSQNKTGDYKMTLPQSQAYYIDARAEGYFPVADNFALKDMKDSREMTRDLYLAPLEVGQTITLKNIFFDFDKWDLRPESYDELDRVALLLNEMPSLSIEIGGHTDSYGSEKSNETLSQNRANAVVTYLTTTKAIDKKRITSKGYGETKPVATNETDEGRQENRRVEVKITAY